MDIIKKWFKKYQHEPYWIDNWNAKLDRPTRLIILDKNGNAVARDEKVKNRRTRKRWKLADHCKYCTNFLIELPEPIGNWLERLGVTTDPCVKCGIRDTLRESNTDFSNYREKSNKGVN